MKDRISVRTITTLTIMMIMMLALLIAPGSALGQSLPTM